MRVCGECGGMRNFSAKQREPKKLESLSSINIEVNKNLLLLNATRLKIATVITILMKDYCFKLLVVNSLITKHAKG